jgi:hypothetical protein
MEQRADVLLLVECGDTNRDLGRDRFGSLSRF